MAMVDVESLFHKFTVSELREIEKKVKSDIEGKKEDLRQMVGRRYRDIIDAADSISQMRVSSENILGSVRRVSDSIHRLQDAQRQLAFAGHQATAAVAEHSVMDEQLSMESVAKLINDILHLGYQAADDCRPLDCSWCFALAEHLYYTWRLKYGKDAHSSIKSTLGKQLDDSGPRRRTILRAARWAIWEPASSLGTVEDAICAVAVLERGDLNKAMSWFLAGRMEALRACFEDADKANREQIVRALSIIQCTIIETCQLFMWSEEESRIMGKLRSITVSRWIPTSVLTYSGIRAGVTAKLDSLDYDAVFYPNLSDVASSEVSNWSKAWSDKAFQFGRAKLIELLDYLDNVDWLRGVKDVLVVSLSRYQSSLEWSSACHRILGREVSLWSGLCLEPLSLRLKQLIQANVENAFQTVLREERMAGKAGSGRVLVKLKARGVVDGVYQSVDQLNNKIGTVDEELTRFLSHSAVESTGSFPFDEPSIRQALGAACVAAANRLMADIDDKAKVVTDGGRMDELVSLAKLCQCLCDLTGSVRRCVLREGSDQWSMVRAELVKRSCELYKNWMNWLASDLCSVFHEHLLLAVSSSQFWLNQARGWENVQIEEETEDGQRVSSSVFVPVSCSSFVLQLAHSLSSRLVHAGAQSMPSQVWAHLLTRLQTALVQSFHTALLKSQPGQDDPAKWRQRRATQLLFDFYFVTDMLRSQRAGRAAVSQDASADEVTEYLESHIDPFDLDVTKPYLKRNVIRSLQRIQGLYQAVEGARGARMPPASATTDTAQLLPVSTVQSRFHPLPVVAERKDAGTAGVERRRRPGPIDEQSNVKTATGLASTFSSWFGTG